MARPKADLGALSVPKDADTPAATPVAPAAGAKAYSRTLTLRLSEDQYRRLRRFAVSEEDRNGQRVTHQGVIETALEEYLSRNGG